MGIVELVIQCFRCLCWIPNRPDAVCQKCRVELEDWPEEVDSDPGSV